MAAALFIIIFYWFSSFLSALEFAPLTEMSASRLNFSLKVASMVNPYFSKAYEDASNKDDQFYALLCPDESQVFRPNHSLAHGMRQAYLAVDILLFLRQQDGSTFSNADEALQLIEWVKAKLNNDKNFLKKVEMANAFQRSGRKSEVSRRQNKEKYESYLLADQENFLTEVKKSDFGPGQLFETENELNIFKEAIVKKFDKKTPDVPDDLYYLSKIFFAAHLFDLRRLPHFDKNQIREEISAVLFGVQTPNPTESLLFDRIWARAGDYLSATGDRDMDDRNKTNFNAEIFCAQAHHPELMVKALLLAKTKPEEKLLQSIVSHVNVMREFKKVFQKRPKKLRANALRDNLKNAPYTASEAYLHILLGPNYVEIPQGTTAEEASRITRTNIEAFLKESKRAVGDRIKSMEPRIDSPDEYYLDILVNAMMEERKNRDKIVFYHTTEPEAGFLFDVYSEMRNQLQITGGDDITTLRAIDKEFVQFNESIQNAKSFDAPREKATVRDFMAKFKGIADDDNTYRTMGLSTNFALFGSDQQKWADTYNMFYLVKNERVATQPLQNDKFFSYIEQYTGIPMDYRHYQPILDRYFLTCNNQPCRNGRLIQIFVDPSAVDEVAYFSVLLGAPVLKNDATPDLSEPIALLRNSPEKIMDYLKDTKGANVNGAASQLLRPGQLELHDLQARLFMRPDIMFDSALVKINSYMRFDLGSKEKSYRQEIRTQVNADLVAWLKLGAPSDPDAFLKELNKLQTLVKEVYQGSTGTDAPKAKPLSESEQLLKLLLSGREEQAQQFFKEHYDVLKDQTFIIPANQSGRGGGTASLADLYKYVPFKKLMETAFQKGLFPGKEAAFQVSQILHPLDYASFVDLLRKIENPELSCKIFLKYFQSHLDNELINTIETIASLDNDELLIENAQSLLELFKYDFVSRILEGVAKIPKEGRAKTIEETIALIGKDIDRNLYIKVNIAGILLKVHDFQKFSDEKKKKIWSIAEQLEDDWEERLYLVDGIAATDEEILNIIVDKLENPPSRDYKDNIRSGFLESAFDAAFKPLTSFSNNPDDLKKVLQEKTEYLFPKYLLKILGAEVRELLGAGDFSKMRNELNFSSGILSATMKLIKSSSLEKRKLVLDTVKKIIAEWNNVPFAVSIFDRLSGFGSKKLEEFQTMSAEEIVNVPITKVTWRVDPWNDMGPIVINFNYNEILRHARTNSKIYNIAFLESIEGMALINTLIKNLKSGLVPLNVCRDIYQAFNRTNPSAGYNKSLIADCVSNLAR